jgi:hypothetical protein
MYIREILKNIIVDITNEDIADVEDDSNHKANEEISLRLENSST